MGTAHRTPTYFEGDGLHFISPTLRFWITAGAGMIFLTKAEASACGGRLPQFLIRLAYCCC